MLKRLSVDELEAGANEALGRDDFVRAYALLREAVRRAPFRQELRERLATALEGKLEARAAEPRPQTHSTVQALSARIPTSGGKAGARPGRDAETPADSHADAEGDAPGRPRTLFRPKGIAGDEAATETTAGARERRRKYRPGQFERRHRRGPLSAMVLGGIVGLALLGIGVAGAWYYVRSHPPGSETVGGGFERARQQEVFEQARRYLQQNSFALAIEQLQSLPPGRRRDERLAEIYIEIGDQSIRQSPPRLEAAQEAYAHAVQYFPDNPDYGVALAQVYYSLANKQESGQEAAAADGENLDLARQTLQAVVDRNPQHLEAYELLARVAIAQRDYKLQQQTLQRIIDISPADSDAARNARDKLRSLGFKYDM
jgi:cytochrome c-type biogenesis protein CcmH/NrfG